MPLCLDILIPHHRDPDGLERSLASLAAQSWPGAFRAVVLDDGSPEAEYRRAATVCAAFREATGRDLALLRHPENLGRPQSRNRLLAAVEAGHVAWLDAGDLWYPDRLARQFAALERLRAAGGDPDRVWLTCAYEVQRLGPDGRPSGAPQLLRQEVGGDQFRALLLGDRLRAYLWTLLGTACAFRRVGAFDERLLRLQDLDYVLRFVRGGGRLLLPEGEAPLCLYLKSEAGRDAGAVDAANRLILAKHRPAIQRYPRALRAELDWRRHRLAARFAAANGDRTAWLSHAARAALGHPLRTGRALLGGMGRRPGRPG